MICTLSGHEGNGEGLGWLCDPARAICQFRKCLQRVRDSGSTAPHGSPVCRHVIMRRMQGCAEEQFKPSLLFLQKSEDMMQCLARTLLREGSKARLGAFGASTARVIATSAAVPAQAKAAPSSSGALTREFQIYRYERIAALQSSSRPVLLHLLRHYRRLSLLNPQALLISILCPRKCRWDPETGGKPRYDTYKVDLNRSAPLDSHTGITNHKIAGRRS